MKHLDHFVHHTSLPPSNCYAGQGERHYLRILLGVVKGATSYSDLRTFDGETHDTFKAAAIARGLLEADEAHKQIMSDGATLLMPAQLRNTFAELLVWEDVLDPVELWEQFKNDMCEDLLYRRRQVCFHHTSHVTI